MTKRTNNMVETKTPKASGSETDVAKVADNDRKASDTLAVVQSALSLNTSSFSPEDGSLLKKAAAARYREFAALDATDRNLASLIVGMQNAAMTSLQYAAEVDCFDVRSQELRNAARAAKVVIELTGALDQHRGRGNQDVQVGQVTVETGGQAIVGNVNSDGRPHSKPEEPDDPTDAPSCAEE